MVKATAMVDRRQGARDLCVMDTDDIAPPPRAGDPLTLAVRQDLDPLSVAELDARIAALEGEIVRTRTRREKAVNHRARADGLFKA